jgi:hypothetical protein
MVMLFICYPSKEVELSARWVAMYCCAAFRLRLLTRCDRLATSGITSRESVGFVVWAVRQGAPLAWVQL